MDLAAESRRDKVARSHTARQPGRTVVVSEQAVVPQSRVASGVPRAYMGRMKNDRQHQRPRVIVIPSSYLADNRTVGGGERYAFEYARALARHTPTTLGLFDRQSSSVWTDELEIRTFSYAGSPHGLFF